MVAPDDSRPSIHADLSAAHARFARAVMLIYLATAIVAITLLGSSLLTDLSDQKHTARDTLALETQVRAQYLGQHLQLLAQELTRLGLRSEIDLLDSNMEPERSLLRLTHEKSAFFNVGVAILDADGALLWAEPRAFTGSGVVNERLLDALKHSRTFRIVPGHGEGNNASVLCVASPILRNGQFTGALLGAVDLVSGGTIEQHHEGAGDVVLALATRDGDVIYPPGPRSLTSDRAWKNLRGLARGAAFADEASFAGRKTEVAGAPVHNTEFTLLSLVPANSLFGPARSRLATRLLSGFVLASVPLLVFVGLLRASWRTFQRSEENALRSDRLRALGEAVDAIAHEVKNSLNGLRVGLDLILRSEGARMEARHSQAAHGLRTEMEHLADFATQLLTFSKGVVPRPTPVDLGTFVRNVTELARGTADARGVALSVSPSNGPIRVRADPALIHVAVANLVGNAVDFATLGTAPQPRVLVEVDVRRLDARVRVTDNGPGVARAVRQRIFEPFVSGRPNGVGLGLALSRKIVRAHGGDLVLEDSPCGTVFSLTLPMEQA